MRDTAYGSTQADTTEAVSGRRHSAFLIICGAYTLGFVSETRSWRQRPVEVHYDFERLPDVVRLTRLHVAVEGNASGVTGVMTGCANVCDADLECLSQWRTLQRVSLGGPRLTAAVLKRLTRSGGLLSLEACVGPLGKSTAEALKRFRALRYLGLHSPAISVEVFRSIGSLRELTELHFCDSPVSDVGLAQLNGLKRLRSLTVSSASSPTPAWRNLAPLEGLRELSLHHAAITDAGFSQVARLPSLEGLWIDASKGVTPKCLRHVRGMKKLNSLYLTDTSIRKSDVAELRRERPALKL